MEAIFFWVFALISVTGGLMLVFHKNPIHSALSLVLTLIATAGLFVVLRAGFVGVLQVLVYAGAIMVLFVFVIMVLNLQREELGLRRHRLIKVMGIILASGFGLNLAAMLFELPTKKGITDPQALFGTVEGVGELVFTTYVVPFEALSLLLLAAIVGAVVIGKKRI